MSCENGEYGLFETLFFLCLQTKRQPQQFILIIVSELWLWNHGNVLWLKKQTLLIPWEYETRKQTKQNFKEKKKTNTRKENPTTSSSYVVDSATKVFPPLPPPPNRSPPTAPLPHYLRFIGNVLSQTLALLSVSGTDASNSWFWQTVTGGLDSNSRRICFAMELNN